MANRPSSSSFRTPQTAACRNRVNACSGPQTETQKLKASSSPTRVLGIDPGLNTTGYGVVEFAAGAMRPKLVEAGVVRSRAKGSLQSRLNEIHSGVREVLDDHNPDLLVLEQLFSHYQRPRTAILMGHARGVICLAAAQHALEVMHLEPTRVKKTMTGNGRAPKAQIQQAVKFQLGLDSVPEPADIADALAIAICGHHLHGDSPFEKLSR